jgi:hypothetical protein
LLAEEALLNGGWTARRRLSAHCAWLQSPGISRENGGWKRTTNKCAKVREERATHSVNIQHGEGRKRTSAAGPGSSTLFCVEYKLSKSPPQETPGGAGAALCDIFDISAWASGPASRTYGAVAVV